MPTTNQMGIKISQAGVNVTTAADYQLLFNSNWPSLAIGYDSTVTLAPSGSATLNHGLGFYAFTIGTVSYGGVSVGRIFSTSEYFQLGPQTDVVLTFDKNNVYLTNNNASNTYSVNVKCFNIDISIDADYTLPQYPVIKTQYDPKYGMKVVKYGKSIGSTDLRDFILNTQAQSPAVLSVVTQARALLPGASKGTLGYINPANYLPWAYAFWNSGSSYTPVAPGFQQTPPAFQLVTNVSGYFGITSTGSGAVFSFNATTYPNGAASIVVLRDPLVVPSQTTVTYTGSAIYG